MFIAVSWQLQFKVFSKFQQKQRGSWYFLEVRCLDVLYLLVPKNVATSSSAQIMAPKMTTSNGARILEYFEYLDI
jgi:hypothetical protein